MNNETFIDGLNKFITSELTSLFTILPAKIVTTPSGYGNKPFIDAQPLITHKRSDGKVFEFAQVNQVPLQVCSGNMGVANVTVPVKEGDIVLLLYAQRDIGNFMNSDGVEPSDPFLRAPLREYPLCAIPCMFTLGTDSPDIDPDNLIVKNDKSGLTLKPSGDIIFEDENLTVSQLNDGTYSVVSNGGSITLDNGSGTLTLQASGDIDANGCTINTSGNVITPAGADLDAIYAWANSHTHTTIAVGSPTTPTNSPV